MSRQYLMIHNDETLITIIACFYGEDPFNFNSGIDLTGSLIRIRLYGHGSKFYGSRGGGSSWGKLKIVKKKNINFSGTKLRDAWVKWNIIDLHHI